MFDIILFAGCFYIPGRRLVLLRHSERVFFSRNHSTKSDLFAKYSCLIIKALWIARKGPQGPDEASYIIMDNQHYNGKGSIQMRNIQKSGIRHWIKFELRRSIGPFLQWVLVKKLFSKKFELVEREVFHLQFLFFE